MRWIWSETLLSAVLLGAAVFGPSASATAQGVSKTDIRIGSFGPLSGRANAYGRLAMNGLEAVFDAVNEAGGVHGRRLRLIRVDDSCTAEGGIAAANKLINDLDVFAIVGGGCSGATLAARPEIVRSGIPFNLLSAIADRITAPPAANVFTTMPTAAIESRAQLQWALEKGAKRIAVVAQRDAWGRARYEPLIAAMRARGIEPVADEEMAPDAGEGAAQALRIMNARADTVIMIVFRKPAAMLIRDATKLGYQPIWIGQTAIDDWDNVAGQIGTPGALARFTTITPVVYEPTEPAMTAWNERIRKRFPDDGLSVFNQVGIGAGQVFVEALRRAGPQPTRQLFLEAMRTMKNFRVDVFPGPITCRPPASHQCNRSVAWLGEVAGKVKRIGITTLD